MPGSLLMFSVSSWCQPSVRSWSSWQCLSSRRTGVPAKLSMIAGNWRKSPSSRNLIFAVHGDAGDIVPQPGVELRDFLRHQPVDVAVPVPNGAPHPVVGRLRLHAEVLHRGVGLRDDLHLVPFFPERGHDLARQIGFPGARVAGQQQAPTLEAVEHRVLRDLPGVNVAHALRLDSGDSVLAFEALDLLASVHGRAVGVFLADQSVHEALELFGQVLEDDAVRFDGLQVPRRHGCECIPYSGDATYSEAITKSCTGRQLRLDNNWVT